MSRPNGPTVQQSGGSVRPPRQLAQPGAQQPGAAPAPQYTAPQYQAAPDPYPAQNYQAYPAAAPASRTQPGYAPQYETYNAQQTPQNYAPQQPASTYAPAGQQTDYTHLQVGTDARSLQRASQYDAWQQSQPAQDPRGYDLGGYTTAPPAAYAPADPGLQRYQQPGPNLDPSHGQAPEWVHQGAQQGSYNQAGFEPSLGTQGYQPEAQGYAAGGEASDQQNYEEEGEYEYEEAPRGRGLKIAAALVGAVIIGGGLAYAYTTIIGPSNTGKPPIIKNATGPSKTKPAEPGGRQFANTDSKIMGRLGDGAGTASEADASGAKKVTTLSVGPDGSIKAPPAPEAQASAADMSFPVAGATLATPKADLAAAAPAGDAPVVVTPPAAPKPTVVAAAPAPATTQSIATAPAAPKVEAPVAPKPTVTAAVQPTVAKKPVAAAPAPTVTGAGYVAVLASVPASSTSRMTALKQFADMQQKYAGVLQNKMPDVKEANLGDKGIYHRLLVGPPGSRDAANQICGQLKTAGYSESCWVTAY